jgi:hypothetical protein
VAKEGYVSRQWGGGNEGEAGTTLNRTKQLSNCVLIQELWQNVGSPQNPTCMGHRADLYIHYHKCFTLVSILLLT